MEWKAFVGREGAEEEARKAPLADKPHLANPGAHQGFSPCPPELQAWGSSCCLDFPPGAQNASQRQLSSSTSNHTSLALTTLQRAGILAHSPVTLWG